MRAVARLVHDDVIGARESGFFARLQLDLARVRQTGFQIQRMMHDRDQAPSAAIQMAFREGAQREAVEQQGGRLGQTCRSSRCASARSAALGFGKCADNGRCTTAHAEGGQQLHHAPVVGIAAGRALEITWNGEYGFSHGSVLRMRRAPDRFPTASRGSWQGLCRLRPIAAQRRRRQWLSKTYLQRNSVVVSMPLN